MPRTRRRKDAAGKRTPLDGRRDHVAIMKKSWGFIDKIASGEKTIESRWSMTRRAPWDAVRAGDIVYFRNAGGPVTARARVERVAQCAGLTPVKVKGILKEYGQRVGVARRDAALFRERFKNKKYCVLIFLSEPKRVPPFAVRKDGFGAMATWLTVPRVSAIKR